MTNINLIVVVAHDSKWLEKEIDSLKTSSLRLALLSVIRRFDGRGGIYGYKISEKLLEYTEGELDASNATFYAVLRRLEKDDIITSEVKESDQGPPRKHYFLTTKGIKVHQKLYQHWQRHYYYLTQLMDDPSETTGGIQ